MFWNFASKKSSTELSSKTSLYFASPVSRSMSPFVDKMMKGILVSSFISSTCINICTFAFLLPLHKVYISDLPQSQTNENDQQLLSVHLCLSIGFYSKNNHSIMNHGRCQRWQLLQARICTWTQSWLAIVKVMTILSPFNQWEFSVSGEVGNSHYFFQRCLQPLWISRSQPPTQLCLLFCASVKFSTDTTCAFNDRGLWTFHSKTTYLIKVSN